MRRMRVRVDICCEVVLLEVNHSFPRGGRKYPDKSTLTQSLRLIRSHVRIHLQPLTELDLVAGETV